MLARVLIAIFVCVLAIFLLMWLITGGASRVIELARSLRNPAQLIGGGAPSGSNLTLPWQIEVAVPGSEFDPSGAQYSSAESQLNAMQTEYEDIASQAEETKNFGAPSPYRGQVGFAFGGSGTTESDISLEYVSISASQMNTAPVSLAGWSLQSALTGTRVALPQAADPLMAGVLNTVGPVTLRPGGSAIVVSGPSPVGVSFRENACTGYLNELQRFAPELDSYSCPDPADSFAITESNLRTYGDSCLDYLRSQPRCHFPGTAPVAGVSPACSNFAANVLSYNGCVNVHRTDPGFASNAWRLYIAAGVELWRNSHDILRLLDAQGRTVDVLTY